MGNRIVRWQDWSGTGYEHLVLKVEPGGVIAESALLSGTDGAPFAASYRITCDPLWRVRKLDVALVGDERRVEITADGAGNWADAGGAPLPHLHGAIDVDLTASPFTNTLPIRRLDLPRGGSAEIQTAYVLFPELTVTLDPQRYTCLEPNGRYRYESLDSDFLREIEVDSEGLVVAYPGLFRRII
jgi:uncharacterized protein